MKFFFVFLLPALFALPLCPAEGIDYAMMKKRMVDSQICARGIKDRKVLAALLKVNRHQFVPPEFGAQAYGDHPLPIGHQQTISQPYIVAFMTEALELKGHEKVLEIGTGSGYQAAVLAEIVKEVYTIEIIQDLADEARERLKRLGYDNVFIRYGDGYQGWQEHAPYDAIIVTAAPPELPQKLISQLSNGGRMVVPVGTSSQDLYLITKKENEVISRKILPVRFVPMVKEP